MKPRLKDIYLTKMRKHLKQQLNLKNLMAVPKITKVVISMGLGRHSRDDKYFNEAVKNIALISLQKPVIAKARKSVSEFNIREGMPSGVMVTLRKDSMYHFIDKFVNIALPRLRDFRGFKIRSFDGQGNFNIGITEQSIFPEVDYLSILGRYGMNISISTSANDDQSALELLKCFNFPFGK